MQITGGKKRHSFLALLLPPVICGGQADGDRAVVHGKMSAWPTAAGPPLTSTLDNGHDEMDRCSFAGSSCHWIGRD